MVKNDIEENDGWAGEEKEKKDWTFFLEGGDSCLKFPGTELHKIF